MCANRRYTEPLMLSKFSISCNDPTCRTQTPQKQEIELFTFFKGAGEIGELILSFDWTTTPLGKFDTWPKSLIATMVTMLGCGNPMWLSWGRELIFFYNESYAKLVLGSKHSQSLGRSFHEVWPELAARAESILRTGQGLCDKDQLLFLERNGIPEETYHTLSFSPVPDDMGKIGGILCVVTDETERTISERRFRTIRELAACTTNEFKSVKETCQAVARILAGNSHDVPFALLYLLNAKGGNASLAAAAGIRPGTIASPMIVSLTGSQEFWPFQTVFKSKRSVIIPDLCKRFIPLPGGPWREPLSQAIILPISKLGQTQLAGFMVVGVSSRRPLEDNYRGFFDLLTSQVATAIANAQTYEEKCQEAATLDKLDRKKTASLANVKPNYSKKKHKKGKLLQNIIAQLPAGVGVLDKSGNWLLTNALMKLYVSNAMPSILPDRAMHWRSWDEQGNLIPRQNWPGQRALRGETVMPGLEMLYTDDDGAEIWLRVSAAPLYDKAGQVLGATSVIQDITQLKQVQEVLRRNAETFTALVERSPHGIFTVDSGFCIRNVSIGAMPAFRKVDPLIGRDFAEVIQIIWPEPLASEIIQVFQHTLETGEPYISPGLKEKRKDIDEIESYTWQVNRVVLADGKNGVVCYFFDTTYLQQVHQAVCESEARFRALTNAMSHSIYRMNPDWSEIQHLQGRQFTADILVPSRIWLDQYFHPDDQQQVMQAVHQAIQSKSVFELEHRTFLADGSLGWTHTRAIPILNQNDEIVEWLGIASDVTRRKEAEQALLEAARHKDRFLATLAHELRNPLVPLRNGLQIMRIAKEDTESREKALTMMERQLAKMVRLIDDLLDLSRISCGKIRLQKKPVEIAKIIQQALDTSRLTIDAAGHELQLDMPSLPVYVDADLIRLAQVFSNLLINAAKFTERGGRIQLSVQSHIDEVIVSVRDNGIGIPAHMLPHIFEMFTQVDQQLDRSQGGLGIGLSLVKQLVELHNGIVEVKSAGKNLGSEFIVRLPLVLPVKNANGTICEKIQQLTGGHRILVVDDNVDVATSLALLLEIMGNETKIAHDGMTAIDAASKFRPGLIILDISMPYLNGYETAREIRKQPWGKRIVIVALTGLNQEKDLRRSQEAGFDAHIAKPIQPDVLEKLLKELC